MKKKRKSEKPIEEPANDVGEEKEEDEVEMKIEEEEEDKENELEDLSKLQDNLLEKATGIKLFNFLSNLFNQDRVKKRPDFQWSSVSYSTVNTRICTKPNHKKKRSFCRF